MQRPGSWNQDALDKSLTNSTFKAFGVGIIRTLSSPKQWVRLVQKRRVMVFIHASKMLVSLTPAKFHEPAAALLRTGRRDGFMHNNPIQATVQRGGELV